jgi:hypothetical protein
VREYWTQDEEKQLQRHHPTYRKHIEMWQMDTTTISQTKRQSSSMGFKDITKPDKRI